MAGDLEGLADQGSPPSSFLPLKSPWDLALQGNGASSPNGLHERGGVLSGRKSQARARGVTWGGGWAWLTLENGFLHCLGFFFFSFKIKVGRKALRQVSGLCCCPGHPWVQRPFCGSAGSLGRGLLCSCCPSAPKPSPASASSATTHCPEETMGPLRPRDGDPGPH